MLSEIYPGVSETFWQGSRILDHMPVFGGVSDLGNVGSEVDGRRSQDLFSGCFRRLNPAVDRRVVLRACFNLPDGFFRKRNVSECGFDHGRKFSAVYTECVDHLSPRFVFSKRGQVNRFVFYAFVCVVRHSPCRVCENACLQTGFEKVWVHKGGRRK